MSFEPQFQRTQIERQDDSNPGSRIHNESSKLPGHEDRMMVHCERADRMLEVLKKNTQLIIKAENAALDIFRYLKKISIDFDDQEIANEQEEDKKRCIEELKTWFIHNLTNLKTKNKYD